MNSILIATGLAAIALTSGAAVGKLALRIVALPSLGHIVVMVLLLFADILIAILSAYVTGAVVENRFSPSVTWVLLPLSGLAIFVLARARTPSNWAVDRVPDVGGWRRGFGSVLRPQFQFRDVRPKLGVARATALIAGTAVASFGIVALRNAFEPEPPFDLSELKRYADSSDYAVRYAAWERRHPFFQQKQALSRAVRLSGSLDDLCQQFSHQGVEDLSWMHTRVARWDPKSPNPDEKASNEPLWDSFRTADALSLSGCPALLLHTQRRLDQARTPETRAKAVSELEHLAWLYFSTETAEGLVLGELLLRQVQFMHGDGTFTSAELDFLNKGHRAMFEALSPGSPCVLRNEVLREVEDSTALKPVMNWFSARGHAPGACSSRALPDLTDNHL